MVNDSIVVSAKLCLGETLSRDQHYLTLSHRWGAHSRLVLISSLIDQFKRHILIAKLSPVFQDAFEVTAALCFTYLWIDSLCIVQDDTRDWEQQSEMMHLVYLNATCNIAAS